MEKEMTALSGIINEQAALRDECAKKVKSFIDTGGYSDAAIDEYKSEIDAFLAKKTAINRQNALETFDTLVEVSKAKMGDGLNDAVSISESVNLIHTLNGNMAYEAKRALLEKFRGNQIALQAIANAFKQHGVTVKDLEKAIINPSFELAKLRSILDRAFMKHGSINAFALELMDVAERMGITIEMPLVKALKSGGDGDRAMTKYGLI